MVKFFPNIRTLVEIGPFSIQWYAVLIMSGAYLAYYVSKRNLVKVGYKVEDIEDMFMGALVFGFIGARIWYVLFSSDLMGYLSNPISIIKIWEGGLAIQGGLIGGAVFGYIFAKKRRLNFIQWADLIVPNILIAQAIGRWGNFMNQEAYGNIVSPEYYAKFPEFIRTMMFIDGSYRQPTFLFESVANIVGWVLIVLVLKRFSKIKRGDLTFSYLMWYGVTRFFIEGFRDDSLWIGPLRIAQVISLIFVVIGLIGYLGGFKALMPSNKPIILFDFDGTLADTQECILLTFKEVFKKHKPDHELTEEELYSFLGPTLSATFSLYFEEDKVAEVIEDYQRINASLHEEHVKEIKDAKHVLDSLQKDGYRMGLVSNKRKIALELGLKVTGLDGYYEVVLGGDEFEPAKPDPAGIDKALELMNADRGNVIYVGDTASDVIAGKRAGSFTIGFVFDRIREKDLRDSNPNRVIDDLNDILEIVKEDHPWTVTMM